MAVRIQLRRGTAAQWATANPTLAQGEVGYELDTAKWKVGTGFTAWNSLAYMAAGSGGGGAVDSFNGRAGAVTLTSGDVTTALGFSPAAASHTHPQSDITGLAAALAAKQPLDQDLTRIAAAPDALATTYADTDYVLTFRPSDQTWRLVPATEFQRVTPDVTAPVVTAASVNSAGTTLSVTFSEAVDAPGGFGNLGFALTASGGAVTTGAASGSGASRTFPLTGRAIESGETLTLAYTPGAVEDLSGNALAAFSGYAVTNNSTVPPSFAESLDFSDARNSQYLAALFEDMGVV